MMMLCSQTIARASLSASRRTVVTRAKGITTHRKILLPPTRQARVAPSRTIATVKPDAPVEIDFLWTRIQEQLQNGDYVNSQETYREIKMTARQQQQLDPAMHSRKNNDEETKWRPLREELFQAWIDRSKDESLNAASLIEAVSQAHSILEDLDQRLSLYALSILPQGEDLSEGIGEEATLDDAPPVESTMVFSAALQVLQAWAHVSQCLRFDAQAKADPHVQRMGRGMPQRAQYLLHQLERLSTKELPLTYYEAVIKTWACSSEHLRGVQAEHVFRKIPEHAKTPTAIHWIVRAWAWSRDPRAAFTATGHLMKRLRLYSNDPNNEEMEPSLEDYEIVFDAWTRAGDKMAPTKALSFWTLWQSCIENGTTIVRPSLKIYRSLLQTATARPDQPDLGQRVVEVLLTRMKEEMIIPDTDCYESAIGVWKNCVLHPDIPHDRQTCLRRITALLADLRSSYMRRMADGNSGATTKAVNYVLESLQVSQHSQRGEVAEGLLKEMEESLQRGDDQSAPNPDSYRHVIDVYQTIKSKDRIPLAKTILLRFKDTLLQGGVNKTTLKKSVEVLNSFVHVCATTPQPVATEAGVSILREALRAIESFRSGCCVVPNQSTYTYLLQAVKELVSNEPSRTKLVNQVFRLCCQDGMVDDSLLKQLMHVTTPDEYQRLVVMPSDTVDGVKVVPESWSRSVLGGRVISADGRKVRPVTTDGRVTETRAMQEFKMRRLRDKRNQKLLQGGRWDQRQDKI